MSVVIIGAGQAGARAAEALRNSGYAQSIALVGEETYLPYERPPLSKGVIDAGLSLEKVTLLPAEYYAEQNIRLHLGTRATMIDRSRRRVRLEDGTQLDYENLILATGVRARTVMGVPTLGSFFFTLRTVDDAIRLRSHLVPGRRVLVIGGGLLGMELAATACSAGCEVTVAERSASVLFKAVASEVADHLMTLHATHGVRVLTGVVAKRFHTASDSDCVWVELSNGETTPADLVIAAIGSLPNTELAEAAGLEVQDGIITDAYFRTSDPHIFAIGDVARHQNSKFSHAVRIESWQNAQKQAEYIAQVLTGSPGPYSEIPWFWTDQFNWNLQILGYPHVWDHLAFRGDVTAAKFSVLYLSQGRLVGANMINNGRELRQLKQLIESGATLDISIAADSERPLKDAVLSRSEVQTT